MGFDSKKGLLLVKNLIKKHLFTNKIAETILIYLHRLHPVFSKFFPSNLHYSKGTTRTVVRDRVFFELDISDYQEFLVYFESDGDSSKVVLKHIPEEKGVVLDIGANIGQTTLWLARNPTKNPKKIIAFEPFPSTFKKLEKNIGLNTFKNIEAHNIALGDNDNELLMTQECPTNNGGYRVYNSDIHTPRNITSVTQTKLDTLLEKEDEPILFIKIDVEGFEYQVLKGAEQTIKNNNPILFIELDDENLKGQGSSAKELIDLLKSSGYNSILNAETLNPVTVNQLPKCHFDVLCKR